MNTRKPLQPDDLPPVLSVGFSTNGTRFCVGLTEGLRVMRTDNCLTTYRPKLSAKNSLSDGGVAVAAVHDDRYLAFVGGGRLPQGKASVAVFWDAVLGRQVNSFDFREPVLGVRLSSKECVIILEQRAIVMDHQELAPPSAPVGSTAAGSQIDTSAQDEVEPKVQMVKAPNKVRSLISTSPNPYALACLGKNTLVLPAQSIGQVQLIPLSGGSKRVLRTHNSNLRAICLSDDGTLLATASEQGTLVRVFLTQSLDQIAEFRRGMDRAIIFSLAISKGNRWLACTSDKGTLHIFDLRPPPPSTADATSASKERTHRKSSSYAAHRHLSGGHIDRESLSGITTGRSSPSSVSPSLAHPYPPGSVQEYYGLRPPPASASPPGTGTGMSAMAALKASPLAPKAFRDVKSVASLPFHMGDEPQHWQGGPSHSWTTAPNGLRKRVKNPVPTLPSNPGGKPLKGIATFVSGSNGGSGSDDDGATILVVGGGSDARWELFRLLPAEGGGWILVNEGFRRYLSRQFVD